MIRYRIMLALAAVTLTVGLHAQPGAAPQKSVTVTIDAGKTAPPISPYVYGQFIEHIGDLINRGLWAEMLGDRKFYNDVSSKPPQPAPGRGGRGGFGMRGGAASGWRPIGADESVVMDRRNPYVGEHTPLVKLAGDAPRGIQQAGLALRKGKSYTGRVVLAGDPGAKVTVTFVWGAGASDRQAIPIQGLAAAYKKFPFQFTAGADTDDGRIEIAGTAPIRSLFSRRSDRGCGGFQAETTSPPSNGATRSAIPTSALLGWTPSGPVFSRTTSGRMSS